MIEVRDLFRIFATEEVGAAALQGLTLSVAEREVVVVLGPSGSGKTTLLRMLAGLDRPSAGSVRVFGLDLGTLSGRRLADYRARETGYAEQHYTRALAPELTAQELVGLRLGLAGIARAERERRADELLERVGLFEKRFARPHELSGGEQQRVAVCAALAHGPRLFLADEPTGELDHANAAVVYGVIGELARAEGCTTVIVSHDPESAGIADRIVHVRDGRLSSEVVRAGGGEEEIVVGRGGWLQLPEEFLRRAGITSRASARVEGREIVVGSAEPVVLGEPVVDEPAGPVRENGSAATVNGLTKVYGHGQAATRVFDGFDAELEAGRLIALTGPSGSGKTTLLHLLAGLEPPSAGEVVVLGTAVSELDRAARARFRRDHLALVGQEPGLTPFLSAGENVELALAVRGVDAAAARDRALEALDSVGLGALTGRRVSRLSAGERERVAIARALAARPAILLADEPTARLDQANALAVGGLLARWAHESGSTVVCATHDRLLIEQADRELALGGAPAEAVLGRA